MVAEEEDVRRDGGVWLAKLSSLERQLAELVLARHSWGEAAAALGLGENAAAELRRGIRLTWQAPDR